MFIKLVIVGLDKKDVKIIEEKIQYSGDSCRDLSNMCKSLLDIDLTWIHYKLLEFSDDGPTVIFGGRVPELVDASKEWISIIDCDEHTQNLVRKIL